MTAFRYCVSNTLLLHLAANCLKRSPFKLLFCIIALIFLCRGSDAAMRNSMFLLKAKGNRLTKNLLHEKNVASILDCAHHCLAENGRCKSFNYERQQSCKNGYKCQLCNETKDSMPDSLLTDDAFDYYEPVQAMQKEKKKEQTKKKKVMLGEISQSAILQENQSYITLLKDWLPFEFNRSKLCYRATRDGWASLNFHSRCDNKGPTVTIVKVGQYIFGGYTNISWGGSGWIRSTESFIFSLRNYYGIGPFTAAVYGYGEYAIYSDSGYGPTFGLGHDLYISSNANSNTDSYTFFGSTYKPPSGYSKGNSNPHVLLAGSYKFSPSEVEVFFS